APRFGAAWDVTGNGRTVVKANWGRYYVNPGTTTSNVNPLAGTSATFAWLDRNSDRQFTTDEFGPFVSGQAPGTAATNFAKDIGHRSTDDGSSGLDRDMIHNLALRAAYVYRRSANNYVNLELARVADLYPKRGPRPTPAPTVSPARPTTGEP